jgi:hypothetical protein
MINALWITEQKFRSEQYKSIGLSYFLILIMFIAIKLTGEELPVKISRLPVF